ncbi:hypothetical protein D0T90_02315 [Neisseria animalis]|uniref:Uncharacterized protein n=1 Tax=Neisseria animalis TaxID=492 RepID=A0A5P3MPM0_NEIAN|nr:hypothetical protein D0T90_02315 [Neisseria animalis]ROW33321.1 hypothetical protein CGZ60_01060 [Neisseria animalis]
MPCRTMCTVCGFAALSHSYFIRLYFVCRLVALPDYCGGWEKSNYHFFADGLIMPVSGKPFVFEHHERAVCCGLSRAVSQRGRKGGADCF